jgi:hypothetical protein
MKILLAEDNPNVVELTLMAPADQKIADEVAVVRYGVEALEYQFMQTVRRIALFWRSQMSGRV